MWDIFLTNRIVLVESIKNCNKIASQPIWRADVFVIAFILLKLYEHHSEVAFSHYSQFYIPRSLYYNLLQ